MTSYFLVDGLTTRAKAIDLGDLIVSSKTSINLNDPVVRIPGRLPPLKDISHSAKTGLSGYRTDIQNSEHGMLQKLLGLCMFNGSAFELESVTTRSFTPSNDFLAESLNSGILHRINAAYKDSLFMVTAVYIARRTMPTELVSDGLLEFIVAYRLRKIDASHLGLDPNGQCDFLDDAKKLVLLDEDAASGHFDTVETFTIGSADCLWNIPLAYAPNFFQCETASLFNECQIWLAQLFLDDRATKNAFRIASWKTGNIGPHELQLNICRLLHMFSLDLCIQCLRENRTDIIAQIVGHEVESISWIITMEISKDLVVASDDFLWLNKESESVQQEAPSAVDSESRQLQTIQGNPRVKLRRDSQNLSLEVIQLAKEFLLEGSAFRQFCDNLRIWVFPVMSEYIESVIRTSLDPEDGIYTVECQARWELPQYWRQELFGTDNLSEILTITGSPNCAQATSASDYLEGVWGSQARILLSAIEKNLALGTCYISFSQWHQIEIMFGREKASTFQIESGIEDATIKVTGHLSDVVTSLTQLSWIAASFRVLEGIDPLHEQDYAIGTSRADDDEIGPAKAIADSDRTKLDLRNIMMSYVRFEACAGEEPNLRPLFKLTLFSSTQEGINRRWSLVPTNLKERSKCFLAGESCWTPLFNRGVLARGFPVRNRVYGYGLELPPSLMTFVAKAEHSVEYQEEIYAFIGPYWILRPTYTTLQVTRNQGQCRQETQWHLEKVGMDWGMSSFGQNVDSTVFGSEVVMINSCDRHTMDESRMFLGYFDRGQVLSGTEELLHSTRISNSNCTAVKSRIKYSREGTVGAGISIKGLFSISGNTKWIMPKGLSATFIDTRDFDDRLDGACNRPIFVYDLDARSAWILTELSVILHMALDYLEQPIIKDRRRPEQGPWPRLPYAQALSEGGLAAYQAIRDHKHLFLYTKTEDRQPVEFWNIIDRFMKELAILRAAESVHDAFFQFNLSNPRLQGWEFHDLVSNEEQIFKKELPQTFEYMAWWDLVQPKRSNVIFGKNFGQLIRPVFPETGTLTGWLKVPTGADLLTASMPAFKKLVEPYNDNGLCNKLGPDLLWHRPSSVSPAYCQDQLCDGKCAYIQQIRGSRKYFYARRATPPSELIHMEAVTFGDINQYHKTLQAPLANREADEPCNLSWFEEGSLPENNASSRPSHREARHLTKLTGEFMAHSSGRGRGELLYQKEPHAYHILPLQQTTLYQHRNNHIVIPTLNASKDTAIVSSQSGPQDMVGRSTQAHDIIDK